MPKMQIVRQMMDVLPWIIWSQIRRIRLLQLFSETNEKNGISDTKRDTIDANQDTIPDAIDLRTKLLLCIEQDAKSTQKEYAAKLNGSMESH